MHQMRIACDLIVVAMLHYCSIAINSRNGLHACLPQSSSADPTVLNVHYSQQKSNCVARTLVIVGNLAKRSSQN